MSRSQSFLMAAGDLIPQNPLRLSTAWGLSSDRAMPVPIPDESPQAVDFPRTDHQVDPVHPGLSGNAVQAGRGSLCDAFRTLATQSGIGQFVGRTSTGPRPATRWRLLQHGSPSVADSDNGSFGRGRTNRAQNWLESFVSTALGAGGSAHPWRLLRGLPLLTPPPMLAI